MPDSKPWQQTTDAPTPSTQNEASDGPTSQSESRATGTVTLDTDDVFHLLQNERRRRVIEYLRDHEGAATQGVDMRDIVEDIAAREHDTSVQMLSSDERQRVYIALYQSHLPKLDDHEVIEYDQDRGWVRLTDGADQMIPYLDLVDREQDDPVSGSVTPWLGVIGGFGVALAGATAVGVWQLPASPTAAGAVVALAALASFGLWQTA